MILKPFSYKHFFDFVDAYLPSGFSDIKPEDPIIQKLEELMKLNNQFFLIMDLTQADIIYASKRSIDVVGISPEKLTPYEMFEAVHPEDAERFGMGRAKLISLDKDLFLAQKGSSLLSTNMRLRGPSKAYANTLFQCYVFYSPTPHKAVFEIQVHTNIEWHTFKKDRYHYYTGNDISLFRFPDDELLDISHGLSPRELEIVKLIETGLSSQEIADHLFLSLHTISTHRSNILERSGKTQISDLIYALKTQGVL